MPLDALAAALPAIPEVNHQDPVVFSMEDARNLEVAGERPRVVVLSRSGSPRFEKVVLIAASVRMEPSSDGALMLPSWSAARVEWTANDPTYSQTITQQDCPALTEALTSLRSLSGIVPDLPVAGFQRDVGPVPPPDIRLHQSFTIWIQSAGRQSSFADAGIQYESVGGFVAVVAEDFAGKLASCWIEQP